GFFVGAAFAVLEGVMALRRQSAPARPWINFVVLAAAFVFNAGSLYVAVRELKRYQRDKGYRGGIFSVVKQSHNPPIFVAVLEDLAALVGVVVAALAIALSYAFKIPAIDALASIVDGALLAAVAVILASEARSLIVGEAARSALL